MNFIEASNIIKNNDNNGIKFNIQVSSSGNLDAMLIYLNANGILNGYNLNLITLPFGTLRQSLLQPININSNEIILMFPWDLLQELDWRSGLPKSINNRFDLIDKAKNTINIISKRNCSLFYIQAPVLPIFINPSETELLLMQLTILMKEVGALIFEKKYFSLSNYLSSGQPFQSILLDSISSIVINEWLKNRSISSKVLITDLDNVMWSGLAAEDGPQGIFCQAEGKGYKHFLYQSLLLHLKKQGILLAVVSRNDLEVAKATIIEGKTLFTENDFIEICASYEPKSIHIKRLANTLNLGIESFVFIDDNPIEIAEVKAALPSISCIQFPDNDDALPLFFENIIDYFKKQYVTEEDLQKTDFYRRNIKLKEQFIINEKGGDLFSFLQDLSMELTIYDRSKFDFERAIQLINKTNQFNLNGYRLSIDQVHKIIENGGRLYTAKLEDRAGTHGEILSCLIDSLGFIHSFVLSCRVFQREIEYVFICKLIEIINKPLKFQYNETSKNTPINNFFKDECFKTIENYIYLDNNEFLKKHSPKLNLFKFKN
jgi:FkbH-like protein